MNNTEQTTTEVSLDEMSLADYRAMRETGADPKPAEIPAEDTTDEGDAHAGEESLGESETEGESHDPESHEEPKADDKKPAKKGGWQRKLDKAEREIEALKAQLAAKPAETAPKAQETAPASPANAPTFDKPKPKIEDFDSIEQYAESLTDWKFEQKEFKTEQAKSQAEAQAESDRLMSAWQTRVADAKAEHADYDRVMEQAKEIAVSPAHQRLFLDSEFGAEIAYELASDQTQLKKFAEMSPLAAARFFGKLESAYESSETPKTHNPVSNAPKPIRPLGSRAGSVASLDVAKLDLAAYRKARESGKLR